VSARSSQELLSLLRNQEAGGEEGCWLGTPVLSSNPREATGHSQLQIWPLRTFPRGRLVCLLAQETGYCRRSKLKKTYRILQTLSLLFPDEDPLMVP